MASISDPVPDPVMRPFVLLLLIAIAASSAGAATYQVGPTRTYATLPALFSAVDLGPGDVVEVDGNVSYPGNIVMPSSDGGAAGNPVTLRGIKVNGLRPKLVGGTNTIEFRLADHVVFEGFEVIGSITDNTFRCIYHHGDDLTIRDTVVHDCPRHGILGADQDSGSITIEYSEIYNAGSGGSNHALYIATDEVAHPHSVFRLQYCYIHDSDYNNLGNGGNLIKSRAERNEIYYNWLENAFYHELELIGPDPNGAQPTWTDSLVREDSDVVGNVIVHRSAFGSVIRAGGDGTGQSNGRYRFANNTIVRLAGSNDVPTIFRLFDGIDAIAMYNNVIWREGPSAVRLTREVEAVWYSGMSQISGSNNWYETGSTFVPPGWTASLTGSDPLFVNASLFDFHAQAGSPLLNAGNNSPMPTLAYEIAAVLVPPVKHPPQRALLAVGSVAPRPTDAVIDIGAFEAVDAGQIFRDGFE